MNRQTSLTSLNVAVFAYLVLPAASIFCAPFFTVGLQRFGMRWHVLLVSCLITFSIVVLTDEFWCFLKRLFASSSLRIVSVSCLFWIFILLAVHGWVPQQMSLLSGIIFALMLPVCLFIASQQINKPAFLCASVAVLTLIVSLENLFLIAHKISNISFATIYLNQIGPLRFFLNPRDGNFLALIQFQIVCLCCVAHRRLPQFFYLRSPRIRLFVLALFSQAFFNGWFTGGRALLLSLMLAFCVLLFSARQSLEARTLAVISFFSGFIAWLASESINLVVSKIHGGGLIPNFVERGSGGRFEIWSGWVQSWFDHSVVFGHGLGFLPGSGTYGNFTPHNLFIQLFADSGMLGIAFFSILIYFIFSGLLRFSSEYSLLLQLAVIPFTVFSLFGAFLFWPSGVWSFGLLILVVSSLIEINTQYDIAPEACAPDMSTQIYINFFKMVTVIIFVIAVISLSDLKYQVLG